MVTKFIRIVMLSLSWVSSLNACHKTHHLLEIELNHERLKIGRFVSFTLKGLSMFHISPSIDRVLRGGAHLRHGLARYALSIAPWFTLLMLSISADFFYLNAEDSEINLLIYALSDTFGWLYTLESSAALFL